MHKTKKRILSALMVVAMLFSMLPAADAANAAQTNAGQSQIIVNGSTQYGTLNDALQAANDGDTITLASDVARNSEAGSLNIDKNVTIDFNGHTFSTTDSIVIAKNHTVTFKDSGSNGGVRSDAKALFSVKKNSKLTIESGNYSYTGNLKTGSADITINGGTFSKSFGNAAETLLSSAVQYTVKDRANNTYSYFTNWDEALAYQQKSLDQPSGKQSVIYGRSVTGKVKNVTLDLAYAKKTQNIKVAEGTSIILPVAPEREQYSFEGWSDGTNTYQGGDTVVVNDTTKKLTAQWKGSNSTITYKSFQSGKTATLGASIGETIYIRGAEIPEDVKLQGDYTLQDAAKNGATFLGWEVSKDEQGNKVFTACFADQESLGTVAYSNLTSATKTIALKDSNWTAKDTKHFTVANDTSGNVIIAARDTLAPGTYTDTVILSKTGNKFFKAYEVTITVTKGAQAPAFATNEVSLVVGEVYNDNALSGVAQGATVTYSSSDESVATVDADSGKVTAVAAGTTTISATISGTDTYDETTVSYKLNVVAKTYKVTFDGNGNDKGNAPGAREVAAGSTLKDPQSIIARTGHTLIGWSTDKNATADNLWNFDTDKVEKDITLYAVWKADQYKVVFKGEGGTMGKDNKEQITRKVNFNGELSIPQPTRDGYTFTGWNRDSGEVVFQAGQKTATWTTDENLTLTATWSPVKYKVNFVVGNETKEGSNEYIITDKVTEYEPQLSAGQSIEGWYLDKDFKEAWNFRNNTIADALDKVGKDNVLNLYAKLTTDKLTITYNDGKTQNVKESFDYGTEITIKLGGGKWENINETLVLTESVNFNDIAQPTKGGATFNGWSYKDNTFTAKWIPNKYTLTFDANGGTLAEGTEPVTVAYGENFTVPANPTKDGYTFGGWKVNGKVNKDLKAGETITVPFDNNVNWSNSGTVTLTASWKADSYTVSLKVGDKTEKYQSKLKYGATITPVNDEDANKTFGIDTKGEKLDGWYKDEACTEKWNFDKDTVTSNITLYGKVVINEYDVTYDGDTLATVPYNTTITIDPNGGTVGDNNKKYKHPVTENTPLPTPIKTGAEFAGWKVDDNTFTAQWKDQTFTLTFDAGEGATVKFNGDKKQVVSQSGIKYGDEITVPTPVKAGATFNGWKYKNGNPADPFNAENGKVTYSWLNDVELEASWTENTYEVYVQVGDKKQLHQENVKYGDTVLAVNATDEVLGVPQGSKITGWYTDEDFTHEWNFKKDTVTDNLTLYAKVEGVNYNITLDANGGTFEGGKDSATLKTGYNTTVTKDTEGYVEPTRRGHKFSGWIIKGQSDAVFTLGETKVVGDLTLVASWTPCTITYYGNGGTVNNDGTTNVYTQTLTDDKTQHLATKIFERPGYKLVGWTKMADNADVKEPYPLGKKLNDPRDMTLYAKWQAVGYTVTFDAAGGKWKNADNATKRDVTVDYQGTLTMLEAPSREGYTFTGWLADGDQTGYEAGQEVAYNRAEDVTVTAQWKANEYEFKFWEYNNGAEYTDGRVKLAHDAKVKIDPAGGIYNGDTRYKEMTVSGPFELPNPTREGWTFTGWDVKVAKGNATFTAHWAQSDFKVTFDANGGNFAGGDSEYSVTTPGKKKVEFPTADTIRHAKGNKYVLLGWSENANGPVEYDISEVSSLTNVNRDVTLYAIWAEVVDFGNIASGETDTKSVNVGGGITDTKGNEHFNLKATGSNDALNISVKKSLDLGSYTDRITITTDKGTTYIIAKVNVTMGEVTVGIANNDGDYVVGDEVIVAVTAAPNQKLTLAMSGNTDKALKQVQALSEDKNNKGHYYATYTVEKITADALNLNLVVKSGDNALTKKTETIQLRTVLNLTVKNSDKEDTALESVKLIDKEDSSKTQAIPYKDGKYTTLVDKTSGWDYVEIKTGDGRTVNLDATTTGQTLGDALLGTKGEINMAYTFSGYTVTGQLYVNGEAVEHPTFSINGDYGEDINFNDLKSLAEGRVQDVYPNAIRERYDTKMTLADGKDVSSVKTYGDSDVIWDNNTLSVKIDVAVGYNVEFVNEHGNAANIPEAQFILHNRAVSKPENPTKAGYVFKEWTTDKEGKQPYDFSAGVEKSLTLYAQWTKADYTVTFNNNYGDNYGADTEWAPQTVAHGDLVKAPSKNPEREGYTFKGWSTTSDRTTGFWDLTKDKVTGSIILYAQWEENEYTVSFDMSKLPDGATLTNPNGTFSSQNVKHGELAEAPEDPALSVDGYKFQGWYSDAALTQTYDFNTPVTGDLVLTPKFSKMHTVTFYTLVENSVSKEFYTIQVADGATVPAQNEPTRAGYVFTGWYTNEACTTAWEETTPVTDDTYLYAGWRSQSGTARFFDKTATSCYVAINLDNGNGEPVPATGIVDLKLTITNKSTGNAVQSNIAMTEITAGDAQWQPGWDAGKYAYYYATYPETYGTLIWTLSANGYTFG